MPQSAKTGGRQPDRRDAGGVLLQSAAAGAALALVATVLRLHGLTRHGLWLDEVNGLRIARLGLAQIPGALAADAGAPLYTVLLHFWVAIAGDGERALRLFSVVPGLLLIPATALLARRVGGARAGSIAAWLVAVTPIAVQFSQEIRMYMLLPCLAAVAAERLLASVETGSRAALVAHAAALAAACYTHNWGLLLVPAAGIAVVAARPARFRAWCVAAGGVVLVYLPWSFVLWRQIGNGSHAFVGAVAQPPAWQLPYWSVVLFASGVGTGGVKVGSLLEPVFAALAAVVYLLLVAAALLPRAAGERRRMRWALLLLATLPLGGACLLGAAGLPIYVLGRYELMVLPFFVALASAGTAPLLSGRRANPALVLLIAGFALLAFGSWRFTGAVERRTPEIEIVRAMVPQLLPGDRIVVNGLYRVGLEYYLRQAGVAAPIASIPFASALHQGWYDESSLPIDDPGLLAEARAACPVPGHRTWFVPTIPTPRAMSLVAELGRCAALERPFASEHPPLRDLFVAVSLMPSPANPP
jgi:hypothetical protein